MKFLTLNELSAKLTELLAKHPDMGNLEIYGWDDGSINIDGFDDVNVFTVEELRQRYMARLEVNGRA